MFSAHISGIFLALSASLFFGSADVSGGLASKRDTPFQVLVIGTLISVVLFAGMVLIGKESAPTTASIIYSGLAGLCGSIGLAALYKGLAEGQVAIVSPLSGVVSAAAPVLAAVFTEGAPSIVQFAGFGIALAGIWLVTQSPEMAKTKVKSGVMLGLLSGIFFGAFFILIAQVDNSPVFFPLMISKIMAFLVALSIIMINRTPLPSVISNPAAILSGVLDPVANTCYLLSTQFTRLDIAAVLSSFYPAVTVFLCRIFFKEVISRTQWIGIGLCLAAIILITI